MLSRVWARVADRLYVGIKMESVGLDTIWALAAVTRPGRPGGARVGRRGTSRRQPIIPIAGPRIDVARAKKTGPATRHRRQLSAGGGLAPAGRTAYTRTPAGPRTGRGRT